MLNYFLSMTVAEISATRTADQVREFVLMLERYIKINAMCKDLDLLPDMPDDVEIEAEFMPASSSPTMAFDMDNNETQTDVFIQWDMEDMENGFYY